MTSSTKLTARDEGRENRQFHLIDNEGRNAAFTGAKCIDWAGHLVGDNVSVAGNMLAGPQVVAETMAAYENGAGKPFAERLLEAMQAGEKAGGDKRGKQSAALVIYRDQDYPWLSIRADDHADPLGGTLAALCCCEGALSPCGRDDGDACQSERDARSDAKSMKRSSPLKGRGSLKAGPRPPSVPR